MTPRCGDFQVPSNTARYAVVVDPDLRCRNAFSPCSSDKLPFNPLHSWHLWDPSFNPRAQISTLTNVKPFQFRTSINDTFHTVSRDSNTSSNTE